MPWWRWTQGWYQRWSGRYPPVTVTVTLTVPVPWPLLLPQPLLLLGAEGGDVEAEEGWQRLGLVCRGLGRLGSGA